MSQISGHRLGAKVDTGASVFWPTQAEHLRGQPVPDNVGQISGKSRKSCHEVIQTTPHVGLPAIQALGTVHSMNQVAIPETVHTAKHLMLLSGIGSISSEHAIRLVADVVPVPVAMPRKIDIPTRCGKGALEVDCPKFPWCGARVAVALSAIRIL